MKKARQFIFSDYRFEKAQNKAHFEYKINFEDGTTIPFEEEVTFPPLAISYEDLRPLETILRNLHLILGISYYKLYCPKKIIIEGKGLTEKQSEFWNVVYTKGLGEFFFKNNIDFNDLIHFPYKEKKEGIEEWDVEDKSLLGLGGGKDSIVATELLKEHNLPFSSYYVQTFHKPDVIEEVSKMIDGEHYFLKRKLDKKLYTKGALPDAYKGHIPVSAIYAYMGAVLSLLSKTRYIISANEKSADVANTEFLGQEINHQWSKSEEFEKLFNTYLRENINSNITYFSLLRPFSELQVIKKFSTLEKYFYVFSSCNVNFKSDLSIISSRWCGNCPKCAFVFVSLAAFITKEKLLEIFKKNLLDDMSLLPLYRQLLGIEGIKPFECVGTIEETQVAFYLTLRKGDYNSDAAIQMFEKEVLPKVANIEALVDSVFKADHSDYIPAAFKNILLKF